MFVDKSLMNPTFLAKELRDATDIQTSDAKTREVTDEDVSRIYRYFIEAEKNANGSTNIVLSREQIEDTLKTLTKLHSRIHILSRVREIMISHYTQLINDRRYRIATKLTHVTHIFRK